MVLERDSSRRVLVPSLREEALGAAYEEPGTAVFATGRRERRPQRVAAIVRRFVRDADPRSIPGSRLALAALGAAAFVAGWDLGMVGVLLPEMRRDLGFDLRFLGGLAIVMQVVDVLFAPLMGYVADRVPRVRMIGVGLGVGAVSRLGTAAAPSVPGIVSTRAGAGLAQGIVDPAAFPLVTDYYPLEARGRVFSFLFAMAALGSIVGPAVSGVISQSLGWRWPFATLGVLGLAVAVTMLRLPEPTRGAADTGGHRPPRQPHPVGWSEAWRSARSITTLRRLWYATPFLTVGSSAFLPVVLGVYYHDAFRLDSATRGSLVTAAAGAGLLGLVLSGPVADRLVGTRPARVMTLLGGAVLLQAVTLVALAGSRLVWLSVALSLPLSFVSYLLLPGLVALISDVVPARMRGLGLQTSAPWRLAGVALFGGVFVAAGESGARAVVLAMAPLVAAGGVVLGVSAFGVERDIRAARAASEIDVDSSDMTESRPTALLACRDISVEYDGTRVLFGVDLDIEENEIVALLGTNGAGKSTLLRAIAGVIRTCTGAIVLDGDDITHEPAHRIAGRGVVMVPGGHAVFPSLTVEENMRAAAWMKQGQDEEASVRIARCLDLFPELRPRLAELGGNLSGGEQQMLALCQALLMEPRLLMIDELSLGLAPSIVERLLETLRLIQAGGTTIILVEQSLNVALTIAERAVFMDKGEVRFDGPVAELISRQDLVRSVFLGRGVVGGGQAERARSRHREASGNDEVVLAVDDITVRFGGVTALGGVTVRVAPGEILGIIGPNGAGKTTLFDAVSGIVQLDGGKVVLADQDISALPFDARARLGLGRSFQNVRLFPSLTVRETVTVALERHLDTRSTLLAAAWAPQVRRAERRAARRVDRLIGLLGLDEYADKFVSELSTGVRRTVDLACVMANAPSVLLLDEPSSGLAQAEVEQLGPLITGLVRDTGCAVMVIEHDLPLVTSVADRLVAMELGQVITTGPPQEVVRNPRVLTSYLAASKEVVTRSGASLAGVIAASLNVPLER